MGRAPPRFAFARCGVVTLLGGSLLAGCNALVGFSDLPDHSLADGGLDAKVRTADATTHDGAVRDAPDAVTDEAAPVVTDGSCHHDDGGPLTPVCVSPSECWISPAPIGSNLYAVWGQCGDVWAVGQSGAILHGDGFSWSSVAGPTPFDLIAVFGFASDDVWAAGDALYHYDGHAWSLSYAANLVGVEAIWGAAADDVWAAGADGTFLHWQGTSWAPDTSAAILGQSFYTLTGTATDDVWAGGDVLLHWDGSVWSTVTVPETLIVLKLFSPEPDDLWLLGVDGTLLRRTKGTWSRVETGQTANDVPVALFGSSSHDVFVLTSSGAVPSTSFHFDGTSWTRTNLPPETFVENGWSLSADETLFVGETGAIFSAEHAHPHLEAPPLNGDVFGICGPLGDDDVWFVGRTVAGTAAAAFHWDGATLAEFATPASATLFTAVTTDLDAPDGGGVSSPGTPSGIWVVGVGESGDLVVPAAWRRPVGATDWGKTYLLPQGQDGQEARGVFAASSSVWAVGDGPTIWAWNGVDWSVAWSDDQDAAAPDGGEIPGLNAISGSSAADIWAVGSGGLAVHWDGTAWKSSTLDTCGHALTSVFARQGQAWAAAGNGGCFGKADTLLLHYDGTKWMQVEAPRADLGKSDTPSGSAAPSVWFDAESLAVLTTYGFVDRYDFVSDTWTTLASPAGNPSQGAIFATGDAKPWVGGTGTIRHFQ